MEKIEVESKELQSFLLVSLVVFLVSLGNGGFFSGVGDSQEQAVRGQFGVSMAAVLAAVLVNALAAFPGYELARGMAKRCSFSYFVGVVVLEEVVRWVLLGVLPDHLADTPFVFWSLLLGGNLVWSASLARWEGWRHSSIPPQFLAGLVYSAVFFRYGLVTAILVHLAVNSMLMSLYKVEVGLMAKDGFLAIYSLTVFLTFDATMTFLNGHSLANMWVWLSCTDSFSVPGWGFFDYLTGMMCAGHGPRLFFIVAAFDQGYMEEDGGQGELPSPWHICLGMAGVAALLVLGFFLAAAFSPNVQCRALLLTLLLGLLVPFRSGSGMARFFWTVLPAMYVGVCVFESVDLLSSAMIFSVYLVSLVPVLLLQRTNV